MSMISDIRTLACMASSLVCTTTSCSSAASFSLVATFSCPSAARSASILGSTTCATHQLGAGLHTGKKSLRGSCS